MDAPQPPPGPAARPDADLVLRTVCAFVQANGLIAAGSRVLAAVSGGADSLALLLILDRLRLSLPFCLAAAHLNHGLRGDASDADETFVRAWCERLGVPFFSRTVDLAVLAAQTGKGLEETGRSSRLAFFQELAERFESEGFPGEPAGAAQTDQQPVRVALAHHRDDQAETLLLHLGRGCGLDGLTGMKPRSGRLIRPLLPLSRREIEDWLSAQGIRWRQDQSNADLSFLRNRLRHQVLPAWWQALGYDPAPLLCRTAASLAEDQALLEQLADREAARLIGPQGLRVAPFCRLAPALQNRLLRLLWQKATGSGKEIAQPHLLALRAFLPQARPGQFLCLPGHWRAEVAAPGLLRLTRQSAAQAQDHVPAGPSLAAPADETAAVPLILPGITRAAAWQLEVEALFVENASQIVYNSAMEIFRLDALKGCVIRHRLPGDRIRPLGRLGGKSLKKYLNEQKVPPGQRPELLLLAVGRDVAWLPGFTASEGFAAGSRDGKRDTRLETEPGQLVRLEWRRAVPGVTAPDQPQGYDRP